MSRTGMTMGSSMVVFIMTMAIGLGVVRPVTMNGIVTAYVVTVTATTVVMAFVWKLFKHYDL